jgi:hypothetical protein
LLPRGKRPGVVNPATSPISVLVGHGAEKAGILACLPRIPTG